MVGIQTYLDGVASNLNLRQDEKEKVRKSIDTLASNLNRYFGTDLESHFIFGSYTRNTILPRKADSSSDIDYMVVFKNPFGYKPQTLLNQLRRFVETYYARSSIRQSHPTIVLELNHIKFELVPAKSSYWGSFYIPSPASDFTEWMQTDPNDFNQKLTAANKNHASKLKPTVRLMKYWNRLNGAHLASYELEKHIVNTYYWGSPTLKDLVYQAVDNLPYNYTYSKEYRAKVEKAKLLVNKAREYERNNMPVSAKAEIQKLFPDI